ncbi:MAG TPA: gluconokinase, GntK/IdnK-type [Gaiellaceae bacterium]|nr:gluconokinase, GntK/IdnK-type [Gaiellaceae bacterium]
MNTIVVCGASGVGKSTVARELAARLGSVDFAEADAFHLPANVAKMASGIPLTDADREPWLQEIANWIGQRERARRDGVVACSALRRRYRDVLRGGHPSVVFVQLVAPVLELERRLATRTGHDMPASLLPSQLEAQEPLEPDEPGFVLEAVGDPAGLVDAIIERIGIPPTSEPIRE